MKQVNIWLNLVTRIAIAAVILSTLFLFTNLTTDFYEAPKFIALVIFTGALLILTTLRFTISGRVTLVRTPLDLPLILLLVVGVVSTILSPSVKVSLLGNGIVLYGSLAALILYVLFYLTLVNNLKSFYEIRTVTLLLLGSGAILSIIGVLSFFGIKLLPFDFAQGLNFTPTGSSFSTTAVLSLLVPLAVVEILGGPPATHALALRAGGLFSKIVNSVLLTLFGVTIALTGSWATWIAALVGLSIVVWAAKPNYRNPGFALLVIPLVLTALFFVLSLIPPLGGTQNPIYTQARNFPREIQLGFVTSWKISVSSFRDNPFWGSGPSTYLFDFTNYKPIEFNRSKFWNLRFDSSFNEYLGVLGTLGGVALLALLSATALFISSAYKSINLFTGLEHEDKRLELGLAASGITLFIILGLHASTLVVWVVGLIILSSFMAVNALSSQHQGTQWSKETGIKKIFLAISSTVSPDTQSETVKIDALPSILLTISVAVVAFVLFFGGKLAVADYHHRLALNAITQNQGLIAYNELVAAEKFNPYNDLYRTDIAQTNFALANAIAIAKGPTEASPGGSFTDADRQNIQTLLQQAINEGRNAVSLSPRNAVNWEILAALYRQISGVAQNALLFSLDSYGRAIQNDPLNPLLRLNVGGVYYAIKNYDLAIRFFTDAINLKPDFANGFYNLSVALRDKGDLNGALAAAEKVATLVDKNSSDYKIATDYLNDLKSKIAGPPAEPPAATASGQLQNEKLPKVVNVGKPPEKIATPTAVKKPNSTPEPSPASP